MNPVHKVKWDYQEGARQIARCSGREVMSGSYYWKDVTCLACRRLWGKAGAGRENFLAPGPGDAVG